MAGLTDEQMVKVTAVAPFEIQHAFALWAESVTTDADAQLVSADSCGGLGPPYPLHLEDPMDFGLRMAAGLLHFLKES